MYMSLLRLNLDNRQVRKDVASPYSMHQTLTQVLGGNERTLWRLEKGVGYDDYGLLVQTSGRPDWQALENRFPGYAEIARDTPKSFDPVFHAGQQLRFRLYANPTVTRAGKRLGLYREEEQLEWLADRLRRAGAEVGPVLVSRRGKMQVSKKEGTVVLAVGQFDGVLRVVEPGPFLEAVRNGIGHGKAFGLGLLSVARVQE